jgi:hypothetical protein
MNCSAAGEESAKHSSLGLLVFTKKNFCRSKYCCAFGLIQVECQCLGLASCEERLQSQEAQNIGSFFLVDFLEGLQMGK